MSVDTLAPPDQVQTRAAVLKLRVTFGALMTVALVALLLTDAWLATRTQPQWPTFGTNLGRWLAHGAISTALVGLIVWLAARELTAFVEELGYQPSRALAQLGAVALAVLPYFTIDGGPRTAVGGWEMPALAIVLGLAFLHQAVRHRTTKVIGNLGTTLLIVMYLGGLAQFFTRLRMDVGGASGAILLLFSVFVVKVTDIGAYFTGMLTGRHKMIEWLSPKKTWEGFAGGIVVATAFAIGVGYALYGSGTMRLPGGISAFATLLAFGLLMAGLSVLGDLCESLLKRDAAIKDSGRSIPGFGGVLDVLDSPLLAAPAMWLFWTKFVSQGLAGA
jgi:phosphatidate cytidylyltransferase